MSCILSQDFDETDSIDEVLDDMGVDVQDSVTQEGWDF